MTNDTEISMAMINRQVGLLVVLAAGCDAWSSVPSSLLSTCVPRTPTPTLFVYQPMAAQAAATPSTTSLHPDTTICSPSWLGHKIAIAPARVSILMRMVWREIRTRITALASRCVTQPTKEIQSATSPSRPLQILGDNIGSEALFATRAAMCKREAHRKRSMQPRRRRDGFEGMCDGLF